MTQPGDQVTESHLYVAERFGGWQEATLLFLASHFRSGATAADFGKLSGLLLQHVRDLDSVKVRLQLQPCLSSMAPSP